MSNFAPPVTAFVSYPNNVKSSLVTASGFKLTNIGTPYGKITYGATGFCSTNTGHPFVNADLGGVGFVAASLGSPVANLVFTPRTQLLYSYSEGAFARFGTPDVLPGYVANSFGPVTLFGTPTVATGNRTVIATGFIGTHIGIPSAAQPAKVSGFYSSHIGVPSANVVTKVSGVGFYSSRIGIPSRYILGQQKASNMEIYVRSRAQALFTLTRQA